MFFNIFHKILHSSFFTLHLFLYFCSVSCAEASIEADRAGNDIYRKKRLLYALFLALRNFANSEHTAMDIAAVDCSGYVYTLIVSMHCLGV